MTLIGKLRSWEVTLESVNIKLMDHVWTLLVF